MGTDMKSIYIISVEPSSGKTAACLALGKHLQKKGLDVGYFKPERVPYLNGNGGSREIAFAKQILGLSEELWELSPIILTSDFVQSRISRPDRSAQMNILLRQAVKSAWDVIRIDKDVMIIEGGKSYYEGAAVGLSAQKLVELLNGHFLALVKYQDEIQVLDDALGMQADLGDRLKGVLINFVPTSVMERLAEFSLPYLENHGIPILGVFPESQCLSAITVEDLLQGLGAQLLTKDGPLDELVEAFTIGTMTLDASMGHFRRCANKAVITGGDRTDIQLAALHTSTRCLVLTGKLNPNPTIIKLAEETGVPILLVATDTMQTITAIDQICRRIKLIQVDKLYQFEMLMNEYIDYPRLGKLFSLPELIR